MPLPASPEMALVGCDTARAPAPDDPIPAETTEPEPSIDQRSYNLGVIGGFAEVVGVGVKRLALSSPMPPAEMDALIDEAVKIVERNGAKAYRDPDFLVTDLFPAEVTEGMDVILIYNDPVLAEYDVDPDVLRGDLDVLIGGLAAAGLVEIWRA